MKKIAVLGGGQVGSSLAKILTDDGNDITLIDNDLSTLNDIQEDNDIKTIHGNASSPSVLEQAEINDCDILIAVTRSDEVNLVSCHLAKKMFNVPNVIARLRNAEYQVTTSGFDLDLFSIDSIISPSRLVTNFIKNIIEHPGAFQAFDFADGKLQVIGATVLKDGPLSGQKLSEFKTKLIPYKGNDSWVEPTLYDLKETLMKDEVPVADPKCSYCSYVKKTLMV